LIYRYSRKTKLAAYTHRVGLTHSLTFEQTAKRPS